MLSTGDIEESTKISFSIATNDAAHGGLGGRRELGTYSYFGVPLYDALQGTGNRLPYQASWAQSSEWPLRYLLSKHHYLLVRVFLSSMVLLLSALRVLRSWKHKSPVLLQALFGLLLISPAGLYLRQNEWSDTFSQSAGIMGVAFLLLYRGHFGLESPNNQILSDSPSDFLLLFGGLTFIVTGHPGMWPIALVLLLSLFLAGVCISPVFRQRLLRVVLSRWIELVFVTIPALLVVAVVAWDLKIESSQLPDWSVGRDAITQGFYSDQALRGFTRGILPDFVERTASVVIAMFFLPVVRVLFPWFQESDLMQRMAGSFPRGEFSGALVTLALFAFARKALRNSPEGILTRIVATTNVVVVALAIAFANDWLPTVLTPSGAWMVFPILLGLNVFMTFVVLNQTWRIAEPARWLGYSNLAIIALWVLMQFSIFSIYPTPHLEIPKRYEQTELSVQDAQQLSDVLSTSGRLAMLRSPDFPSQLSFEDTIRIVQRGKSVLAPADAKIRNVSHLNSHVFSDGRVPIIGINEANLSASDRLLEFFQVEQAMIELSDPLASAVREFVGMSNETLNRKDTIRTVGFVGIEFVLWTRSGFSSSVLSDRTIVDSARCPLFEQSCLAIQKSLMLHPRSSPRLTICEDPCLWRYKTDSVPRGRILVLPISFDAALVAQDSYGTSIETTNIGGFLSVSNSSGLNEGFLEVSVQPDARMYARVLSSYVQLGALLLLALVVNRRRWSSEYQRATR